MIEFCFHDRCMLAVGRTSVFFYYHFTHTSTTIALIPYRFDIEILKSARHVARSAKMPSSARKNSCNDQEHMDNAEEEQLDSMFRSIRNKLRQLKEMTMCYLIINFLRISLFVRHMFSSKRYELPKSLASLNELGLSRVTPVAFEAFQEYLDVRLGFNQYSHHSILWRKCVPIRIQSETISNLDDSCIIYTDNATPLLLEVGSVAALCNTNQGVFLVVQNARIISEDALCIRRKISTNEYSFCGSLIQPLMFTEIDWKKVWQKLSSRQLENKNMYVFSQFQNLFESN
jgi:hypothetical protein